MTRDFIPGAGIKELAPKRLVTHVYPDGGPFTHFKVNGIVQTREHCVKAIKNNQNYWTSPPDGSKGAEIRTHKSKKTNFIFLRTDKNEIDSDNLGDLPIIPKKEI